MTDQGQKVSKLSQIEDRLPHLAVPTPDGEVHVIPVSVFYRVLSGELKITDIDDWEPISRVIVREWLRQLGLAREGTDDWGDDD